MLFPWWTLGRLIWLYFPWSFSLPRCSWATRCYCSFFLTFDLSNDSFWLRINHDFFLSYVVFASLLTRALLTLYFLSVSSLLSFLLSSITLRFSHPWKLDESAKSSPARTLQAHAGVHRSMVKSRISHSKSCSRGRRELLQKSLNNHVFPLIYSKYLRREQIKAGEERGQYRWSGWRMGGPQGTLLS